MSETPFDDAQPDPVDDDLTEPPGDPVLTGDPVIDEALVRLDALDGREVDEHPAEYEHIHRVLRDSLAGARRDDGHRSGA